MDDLVANADLTDRNLVHGALILGIYTKNIKNINFKKTMYEGMMNKLSYQKQGKPLTTSMKISDSIIRIIGAGAFFIDYITGKGR